MITDCLSKKEKEVLKLTLDGNCSKVTARLLNKSYRTVEKQREIICEKTNSKNLLHLAGKIIHECTTNI